jgi:hypothetical protein
VLAHLVITYNPFPNPNGRDAIIVVLDGVSGPATFGLAEVLTGGKESSRAQASERLLKSINALWDEESKNKNFRGIEGFIEVKIKPPDDSDQESLEAVTPDGDPVGKTVPPSKVRDKFYDKREVKSWEFCEDGPAANPRPLPV